ncbi:MAG: hypothetical protein R6X33_09265 [Candidatus Brocadiia bacterium]
MVRTVLVLSMLTLMGVYLGCDDSDAGPAPRLYGINWKVSGWSVQVFLNGLLIEDPKGGGGWSPVTNLVVDGTNTVLVSGKQTDDSALPLIVGVGRSRTVYEEGRKMGGPVEEWLGQLRVEPSAVGTKIDKTFEFKANVPITWFWQGADVIEDLSESDREAILEQVRKVRDALRQNAPDLYAETIERRLRDWAHYTGESVEEVEAEETAFFRDLLAEGDYTVSMREPTEIEMEVFGRLVLINAGQWPEYWLIRVTSEDGRTYRFSRLIVCRIDGKWYRVT